MSENHQIPLEADTEYIVAVDIYPSVDVPISTGTPLHTYFRSTGSNNGNLGSIKRLSSETVATANKWSRIILLAKTKAVLDPGAYFKLHIYSPAYINATNPAWVKDIQFIKGNKATNWAPAPEDQVSDWNTTDATSFSFIKNKPTTFTTLGLTDNAGSATQPVYFSGGKPVATTYSLGKSVPSSAVFTDTNTHYTTRLYTGASGTATNTALSNPYIKVTDDNSYSNQIQLFGGSNVTVASDANGRITINSSYTNTNT